MMPAFQLVGLEATQFQKYFEQSEVDLHRQNIKRVIASKPHAFPCRVSLQDAEVGDELLLLAYGHHEVSSPYQASGPIYVRKGAKQAMLAPGTIPDYVTRRVISIRAYDNEQMMINADVVEGDRVGLAICNMFGNASAAYIHLHNAKQGCFSCLVIRTIQ